MIEAGARQSFIGTLMGSPGFGRGRALGEIAAELEEFVRAGAAGGLILVPHPTPGGLDEFVDRAVPLLQERGVFHTGYRGTTPRSHQTARARLAGPNG